MVFAVGSEGERQDRWGGVSWEEEVGVVWVK